MLNRVGERVFATIEEHGRDAAVLAFWMANASELLHFLKSDRHITSFSHQAQDMLAEAVHLAFKQLVVCLQSDLEMTMPALMSPAEVKQHVFSNKKYHSLLGYWEGCVKLFSFQKELLHRP